MIEGNETFRDINKARPLGETWVFVFQVIFLCCLFVHWINHDKSSLLGPWFVYIVALCCFKLFFPAVFRKSKTDSKLLDESWSSKPGIWWLLTVTLPWQFLFAFNSLRISLGERRGKDSLGVINGDIFSGSGAWASDSRPIGLAKEFEIKTSILLVSLYL